MRITYLLILLTSSSIFSLVAQTNIIKLPPGFKAEQLLKATKDYGSFTCLAFDKNGFLYASDEKKGLARFERNSVWSMHGSNSDGKAYS